MQPRFLACAAALLAASVQAHAGLIGFYPFEGNANDVSGNGNHGVLSAPAPTLTAPGGGYTGWGNPNSRAYAFGAGNANTYIQIPVDINPSAMPQVTFGAWVKASSIGTGIQGIMSHDNVNFDRTLDIDWRGPSANYQWCMFGGPAGQVQCGPDATTDWTFLVARYNAATSTAQLTVDGVHYGPFTANPGSGWNYTLIGRNPSFDFPFQGLIDNAFIYDQYLTDAQVTRIYRSGVPEPSTFMLLASGLAAALAVRRRRS